MRIDAAADPILRLERASGDAESFRQMIRRAVGEAPARIEAEAEIEAARAARGQARAGLFPYVDVATTSFRTIARDFSGDLQTIVERARGLGRSDITLNAQQTVYDFGATSDRIGAANARLLAAAANSDDVSDGVALRAIGAWYDVYVFRALVALGEALTGDQAELRRAVEERIAGGVSAAGDVARVDSYIASGDTRLAGYRRRQADAEARYAALLRVPAPAMLSRAPLLGDAPDDPAALRDAAVQRPAVVAAEAQAEAARQDARAARADTKPQLTAGIQSGRYGYLEGLGDYDVRGVVTLRKRFFGGVDARADQIRAEAGAAAARAARAREEAIRDAEIAASDVAALDRQLAALSASYIAARRSRDVLLERFRVQRGTLFDVLAAEDSFFLAAASWIQTLGERDAARYVLLSRTGRLLPALDIPPTQGRPR